MLVIITANIFIINIIFSHFTIIIISHKYYRILYHLSYCNFFELQIVIRKDSVNGRFHTVVITHIRIFLQ